MSISLSDRVGRIKPSPTLAVTAQAAALRAQGKDIIDLGVGEPDFDTPTHIKDAAKIALDAGFTKYTAVDGIVDLKQAVIDKFQRENKLTYHKNQILVSVGGKHSFYNLAQALLNEGDEVIIPAPYWVSYPDMCLLAGGRPVIIDTTLEQRFKVTPQQLADAITEKTKLFVINSPSNPSGMEYYEDELKALGAVLLKHPHVLIATDDMYEHIRWSDSPYLNILNVCPELYERTIVLNGVSKAYAMTGWRIGYAGGPANLINAMKNIQSQSTSNPASISQKAAITALNGDQTIIKTMVKAFKERHDFVVKSLNAIDGIRCAPADGAFYAFFDVQDIIDRLPSIEDDVQLTEMLLNTAGIALVPGSAFGTPGFLRLSFATSMENLQKAMERLKQAVS